MINFNRQYSIYVFFYLCCFSQNLKYSNLLNLRCLLVEVL